MLGALLARGPDGAAGSAVALLEPRPPPPLPARRAPEARVVALSRASERVLARAGAWAGRCGPRLSPYERMRIWHESVAPASDAVLVFDAADVGEPNLGYMVENRLLQGALLRAFAQAGGHIEPAPFTALEIGEESVTVAHPARHADGAAGRRRRRGAIGAAPGGRAYRGDLALTGRPRSSRASRPRSPTRPRRGSAS